MQFARAVGCQDGDDRRIGPHRTDLGDRYLEIGQEFEQERLERVVGAVDLVDQEHGRSGVAQCLEKRHLDQEFGRVEIRRVDFAPALGDPHLQQLARVIPIV